MATVNLGNLVVLVQQGLVENQEVMDKTKDRLMEVLGRLQDAEHLEVLNAWEVEALLIGLLECLRGLSLDGTTLNHRRSLGTLSTASTTLASSLRERRRSSKAKVNGKDAFDFLHRFAAWLLVKDDLRYFHEGLVWFQTVKKDKSIGKGHKYVMEWNSLHESDLEANFRKLGTIVSMIPDKIPAELITAMKTVNGDFQAFQSNLASKDSKLIRAIQLTAKSLVLQRLGQSAEVDPRSLFIGNVHNPNDVVLGAGAFGELMFGVYGNREIVLRRPKCDIEKASFEILDELLNEINLWKSLDHRNLCEIDGMGILEDQIIIVMEKCDYVLDKFIHDTKQAIDPMQMETIVVGIAQGLRYLHSKYVLHYDLKPINVLLNLHSGKVKLCNFCIADIRREAAGVNGSEGQWMYVAPEAIKKPRSWNTKSDIFSFGITFWELLHRKRPWNGRMDQIEALERICHDQERPQFTGSMVKPWMMKFIKRCWAHDPEERPSASDIVREITENRTSKRRSTWIVRSMIKGLTNPIRRSAVSAAGQAILRAKTSDDVLELMNQHHALPRIQEVGCEKLRSFVVTQEMKETFVREGGAEIVIEAMKLHPADVGVQEQALALVWTLSLLQDCKENLLDLGAGNVILDAMRNHPSVAYIQENACGSIWGLCTDCPRNQQVFLQQNVLQDIVTAITSHPVDDQLIQQGCGAMMALLQTESAYPAAQELDILTLITELLLLDAYINNSEVQRIGKRLQTRLKAHQNSC